MLTQSSWEFWSLNVDVWFPYSTSSFSLKLQWDRKYQNICTNFFTLSNFSLTQIFHTTFHLVLDFNVWKFYCLSNSKSFKSENYNFSFPSNFSFTFPIFHSRNFVKFEICHALLPFMRFSFSSSLLCTIFTSSSVIHDHEYGRRGICKEENSFNFSRYWKSLHPSTEGLRAREGKCNLFSFLRF